MKKSLCARRGSLDALREGECGTVEAVLAKGAVRKRLTEIGLTEDTAVCCVRKNLFGDPVAYRIRGTLLALRRETAALIRVRGKEPETRSPGMK